MARRAGAWEQARPVRLAGVFLPGSQALYDDRAALRDYIDRGYSLSGVRLFIARARLLDREPGIARIVVVDWLGDVVAHRPHAPDLRLPQDRPSRHLVTLVDGQGGWRISEVRAV